MTAEQRRDLLEIMEDRHGRASTMVTSQLPVEHWHEIIGDPRVRKAIDFEEPVAILLVGLLHLVADSDDPAAIAARFRAAIPSGGYLVMCHITGDYHSPEAVAQWIEVFGGMAEPMVPRPHEQVGRYLDGEVVLVTGAGVGEHTVNNSSVETTQIAPTILKLLGLNPKALKAVEIEHPAALPISD